MWTIVKIVFLVAESDYQQHADTSVLGTLNGPERGQNGPREGVKRGRNGPAGHPWGSHHATANFRQCAWPQRRTRAAIAVEIPTFSPRIYTRAAKVGILPRMQHTARTLFPVCNTRNNFRKNCAIRYAKIVNAAP